MADEPENNNDDEMVELKAELEKLKSKLAEINKRETDEQAAIEKQNKLDKQLIKDRVKNIRIKFRWYEEKKKTRKKE